MAHRPSVLFFCALIRLDPVGNAGQGIDHGFIIRSRYAVKIFALISIDGGLDPFYLQYAVFVLGGKDGTEVQPVILAVPASLSLVISRSSMMLYSVPARSRSPRKSPRE